MGVPIEIEPMPVDTPLGSGWARIFESEADDNFWTVVLNDSRALVTFRQRDIRVARNFTYGRAMSPEQMTSVLQKDK